MYFLVETTKIDKNIISHIVPIEKMSCLLNCFTGNLPQVDGTVHNMKAVITPNRPCSKLNDGRVIKFNLQVKNCGTFRVYHLLRTPFCPAAYCIGS